MQTAFSFDSVTVKKVLKGALISACGAGAIAFLEYIGKIQINDPTLTIVVAWAVPTGVNMIKEYIKGY